MPRRNTTQRRQARRRGPEEKAPRRLPPRPPVEQAVLPHGRCHLRHGKLKFHADEIAKALSQAQALRRSRGQYALMEQRYYECETDQGGCGAWHLTSRTTYIERGKA